MPVRCARQPATEGENRAAHGLNAAMPAVSLRRFTNADALQKIGPIFLIELLAPHHTFLTNRGFALPVPPGTEPFDYETLAGIFGRPDTDMPQELADALYSTHEMATPEGMDKLQHAAAEHDVDLGLNGEATPEAVSVRFWLRNQTLFEEMHAEHYLTRPRSFLHFYADAKPLPPFVAPTDATKSAMQDDMDPWFEIKRRGTGCRLLAYPADGECLFMVRHGTPCRLEGSHNSSGGSGSVFYRPQQHDVLVYNEARGELRIHAETKGERELYKRVFGLHLFGDPEFFPGEAKFTLAPLITDGAAAMNSLDVDGMEWVRLKEVEMWWPGTGKGNTEREIHKAKDLFAVFAKRDFHFLEYHHLTKAVFGVKFASAKSPRSVTIKPSNMAKYDRDGDSVVIEEWLTKRGFILVESEDDETGEAVE